MRSCRLGNGRILFVDFLAIPHRFPLAVLQTSLFYVVVFVGLLFKSLTFFAMFLGKNMFERPHVASSVVVRLFNRFISGLWNYPTRADSLLPVCSDKIGFGAIWDFFCFFLVAVFINAVLLPTEELLLVVGVSRYLLWRDVHALEVEPLIASVTHDHGGLILGATDTIDSIWGILLRKTGTFIVKDGFLRSWSLFEN